MRLILCLVLFSAAFADENGYVRKPARDHQTSEPLTVGGVGPWIRGTFYNDTIEVPGTDATEESGGACDPTQLLACWNSCQQQIIGTTCQQMGSWCEQRGGGGASCHCQYFCPSSGGPNNKPKQLMVKPEEGWSEGGPCL